MENLLRSLLLREPPSILVRYGLTAVIVFACFLIRFELEPELTGWVPFLFFIPAVFLASLLFDLGCGLFATALSAFLANYAFFPPRWTLTVRLADLLVLSIFVVIGVAIAKTIDALRQTIKKLAAAEREKALLLEELAHRTKNDLTIISSLLKLQAQTTSEVKARAAIESAVARVGAVAKAQERLHAKADPGKIEIAAYLQALCHGLGDLLNDVRPIKINVEAELLEVRGSTAVSVGLIVNELITNAFKYAFPGERGGAVNVKLRREGEAMILTVEDDGVGCASSARRGMGSRLVSLLVGQLNGTVVSEDAAPGTRVTVRLPCSALVSRAA